MKLAFILLIALCPTSGDPKEVRRLILIRNRAERQRNLGVQETVWLSRKEFRFIWPWL